MGRLLLIAVVSLSVVAGCSRTDVTYEETDAGWAPEPPDGAPPEEPDAAPFCPEARPEICDGLDDDCDGEVDEDVTPQPCPTGGVRYCLGGHWSLCPCSCVPGSVRWCFGTYCTGWGVQSCQSNGSWSEVCEEAEPPPGCHYSYDATSADEECCLEIGGCCVDYFDLDGDGDSSESIGDCAGMVCS